MKKIHLLAASILFCFSSLAQAPATLNLVKGSVYQVDSKIQTNSKTNYMGQDMESKANINAVYELEVADASANQYTINSSVKAMKVKMEQMGQEMQYDSEDTTDTNNPMAASFSEILNKKQTVTINKSGQLVEGAADSTLLSPMMKQLQTSGFGTSIGFIPIPAGVKAGDKWTVSEGDTTGLMNTTNYTVKSVSGDMVTLDFTGETKSNMTVEANGMEVKTKTQGTFNGNATVAKSGVVQAGKSTVKSSGNISVMGQDMPTDVTVESETTVKQLK